MPETSKLRGAEPTVEEERPATPPLTDQGDVDDKCTVVVPSTAELVPLATDSASELHELVANAVDGLRRADDWMRQYESVLMARRVVVFTPWCFPTLPRELVTALLNQLTLASDDLRSALVRNALLALAECFARLPREQVEPHLAGDQALLDMLLRRCVCEKKFLRDAALLAVDQLVQHLAGVALMAGAAHFAASKNARLCGCAAGIIATSLERLVQGRHGSDTALVAPPRVFQALAALREAKGTAARAQAAASFKLLAKLMGPEQFEAGLAAALGANAKLAVARITKEACPSASSASTTENPVRRGSLRDRIQLESRSKAC